MSFEQYADVIDFVRVHHAWAAPIVFALAFLELIAFFSLLIPGCLDSGAKRNGVKRSGFERPFQARQARLGMAS